ncbi:MAG: glycosyltransferase family 2 protein [Erysipelotrichaceae bacterium]|nr:glycosyltransferase family 2 protein [Erysipelotrichaceae bacterium]
MNLISCHWLNSNDLIVKYSDNGSMYVENNSNREKYLYYPKLFSKNANRKMYFDYRGTFYDGYEADVCVLNRHRQLIGSCPINSTLNIEFDYLKYYFIAIRVPARTSFKVTKLLYREELKDDYFSLLREDVLLVTTDCINSRIIDLFKANNVKADIVNVNVQNGFSVIDYEGDKIIKCSCFELRSIIRRRPYKKIVVACLNKALAAMLDVMDISDTWLYLYIDENSVFLNDEEYLPFKNKILVQDNCYLTEYKEDDQKLADFLKDENEYHQNIHVEPSDNPVLSIIIPSYNVSVYLKHAIYALMNQRNAGKLDVMIVNDGSKDNTSELGRELSEKYAYDGKSVIRVIDKENGGHGSTINTGIRAARGKYVKVIDGDDVADSEGLAQFIDYLEKTESDLVLTNYKEDLEKDGIFVIRKYYENLEEGREYNFDDLCLPGGFNERGPLIHTSTFKTDLVQKADFLISEKSPYVDMELNTYLSVYCNTVTYYNINLY